MNVRDKFESLLAMFVVGTVGLLIIGGFLWLEIMGIYHSRDKHSEKDGWEAVYYPVIAWYRAVEYFWHDDYAGLDWAKRIKYDTKEAIVLISLYGRENMPDDYAEKCERNSARIRGYPDKMRKTIAYNVDLYIEYDRAITEDAIRALRDYESLGVFRVFPSSATTSYKKQLHERKLDELAETAEAQIESFTQLVDDRLLELPPDEFDRMMQQLHLTLKYSMPGWKKLYQDGRKSLFDS